MLTWCMLTTMYIWRSKDSSVVLPLYGSRGLNSRHQVCVARAFSWCIISLVPNNAAFLSDSLRNGCFGKC